MGVGGGCHGHNFAGEDLALLVDERAIHEAEGLGGDEGDVAAAAGQGGVGGIEGGHEGSDEAALGEEVDAAAALFLGRRGGPGLVLHGEAFERVGRDIRDEARAAEARAIERAA